MSCYIEKTIIPDEQWEAVIRGMRNPMNSWDKSDSFLCREKDEGCSPCYFTECPVYGDESFFVMGKNDHDLMMKLSNAGTDHSKFMRMIIVYTDITAPLYWWKEFDTYKVGTVANSCSTMHKIADKEFTLEDFSCEHLGPKQKFVLNAVIEELNYARDWYHITNATKKNIWWQMIQLLPSSYNQKRTVMLNYQVLKNIYHSRKNHPLDEWRYFCKWIEKLPYSELITGGEQCQSTNSIDCTGLKKRLTK